MEFIETTFLFLKQDTKAPWNYFCSENFFCYWRGGQNILWTAKIFQSVVFNAEVCLFPPSLSFISSVSFGLFPWADVITSSLPYHTVSFPPTSHLSCSPRILHLFFLRHSNHQISSRDIKFCIWSTDLRRVVSCTDRTAHLTRVSTLEIMELEIFRLNWKYGELKGCGCVGMVGSKGI